MLNLLLTLSIMLISSLIVGRLFELVKLPALVGMIAIGIVIGPNVLNWISPILQANSIDLREIALIIILSRASFNLDVRFFKKMGRSTVLLCFLPATCEILGYLAVAPNVIDIPYFHGVVMGTIMTSSSPAVVIPRMLYYIENKYSTKNGLPQMLIFGSAIEDVFCITLLSNFVDIAVINKFQSKILWELPVSIILGIILGIICGLILVYIFRKINIILPEKIVILMSLSLSFVSLETYVKEYIPVSGLLAVIFQGIILNHFEEKLCKELTPVYSKMWIVGQMFMFVLVGSSINISHLGDSIGQLIAILFICLFFRIFGVFISVLGNGFTWKEILFCCISYLPRAAVQAALCEIPLKRGLSSGLFIMNFAILDILFTAPIGAILTDFTYPYLLTDESENEITIVNQKNDEDKQSKTENV